MIIGVSSITSKTGKVFRFHETILRFGEPGSVGLAFLVSGEWSVGRISKSHPRREFPTFTPCRKQPKCVGGTSICCNIKKCFFNVRYKEVYLTTLQGTNISPKNGILKMIFLFPRWDMLISWRVFIWYHL